MGQASQQSLRTVGRTIRSKTREVRPYFLRICISNTLLEGSILADAAGKARKMPEAQCVIE